MPVIMVHGPKMNKEQKAELVKSFTEAASKIMNIPTQAFTILIQETERENVGVGGVLLVDRDK
ncbi:4-oxalocrotonate tautomerase [Desulfofundulus australicus DSM 11792]|jgi:4-oxalocrotonate tautomerase|uniref:4-oxalocrotonate tautomerase n=1 Tax=Desulfofundulus australicus DSM 11792 TaxID=1121425 RepID=A0A1M4Z7R8_9FIRM|nr:MULTISPECIES: 4-oxalocrotonate tautomerase DmpI [Desulfofundulus]SHF14064.1 4-oxalocrotonate tautomerase [Desulfofundulus australicus DSM 11792]